MRTLPRLTLVAVMALACAGPTLAALSGNLIPNGDFESLDNLKMAGGNDNVATYIPIHRFNTDTDWSRWLAKWGPPSQADNPQALAGFSTYDDPRDLNVVPGDTQTTGDLGTFNRSLDPTNPGSGNHVMENTLFRPRMGMWIHAPENQTTGPMSFSFDFNQFLTQHTGAWLNVTLYGLNFEPVHDTAYLVDNSPGNFMTPMSYDNAENLDGALLAHFRFGQFLLTNPPAGQDFSNDFGVWHTVSTDTPADHIWQSAPANIITSNLTQTYQNYAVIISSIAYGESDTYFWLLGNKITDSPSHLYDNFDFRLTLDDGPDYSPYLCDFNLDGLVNVQDINPFVKALTNSAGYTTDLLGYMALASIPAGDFDLVLMAIDPTQDGSVSPWPINVQDINPFVAALTGAGVDPAELAAIPEPATLSLLALGALALTRRQR